MHLLSDGAHEPNRGPASRPMFGGLETFDELENLNFNPQEQNRVRSKGILRSLNVLGYDSLAFVVALVNECDNQSINNR